MKGVLFVIPLMIIATLLYMYQSEKVNKDIEVKHQEMRVEAAKFDADFDKRWGDKSEAEIAQNTVRIESENNKLLTLYEEQKKSKNQRESATEAIKTRLNNELNSSNSNSVYDEFNK
jgi:benzoyl-CoA reductase/2-hydroxyglutaryl-CoA dehydratase subunit BcrC/BadD/HgdB